MSLRSALDRITAIQAAISITDPTTVTVAKAYKYLPPASVQLPDLPCFLNEWTMLPQDAGANMRVLRYTVEMTCAVAKATVEDDRSADIATALWEATVDAFGADLSLDGNCTIALLRGGEPTLGVVQRGGAAYIGFTAYLDIQMTSAFAWG